MYFMNIGTISEVWSFLITIEIIC